MSHPPIQIVDDNDQPVGGADMLVAYEKGLIHRIVFVIVDEPGGRILLQKRGPDVVNQPNCWDISVGGHVDADESYETAAQRELSEELGLTNLMLNEVDKFYHEITVNSQKLKRFNKIYRVTVPTSTPIKAEPSEITETKWFDLQGIKDLMTNHPDQIANGLKVCIERYY